jgi:predicted metal-dependent peptidase
MAFKLFTETGETATRLMLRHPWFMTVWYSMTFYEMPPEWPMNTAGTNGVSVWISPAFWKQCEREQRMTLGAHECGHRMYCHPSRRCERHPIGWNIAGDHRINLDLKESGFVALEGMVIDGRPFSWFCDDKYNHPKPWTTEEIYDDVIEQAKERGKGKGPPDNEGRPTDRTGEEQLDAEYGNDGAIDLIDFGEFKDGDQDPNAKDKSPKDFEQRVREELKEMAQLAKLAGKAPSWLTQTLQNVDHVKVNWWEVIEELLRGMCATDYSWARMHRREYVKSGAISPDLWNPTMGGMVVYVDCSGSCWSVLNLFNMHFKDLVETLRPAWVEVRYFQTQVEHRFDQRYERGEFDVSLKPTGGGGTDFSWLSREVSEFPERPDCVFVLTDMYGDFGPEVTEVPVYWLSVSGVTQAPFGEVISIR